MSDNPDADLEKYTWHKDDVVWEKTPGEGPIKGLETIEKRRLAWRVLNPDTPYPPSLQEEAGKTADARPKRPQVRVHIHRGR